jgi:putative two-component system response regulator
MANDAAKRILIVDDDPSFRRLATRTLQNDYAMEEAGYGKQALERIVGFMPGLVLLDIVMPGIDGHETCRRIKASWPAIRVMMVSARSSSQEQLRAFEAGADDYVVKPFDPQDFCARIRLHFQLQEALAGAAAIRSEIESHNLLLRQEAKRHTQDMIALQDIAVFTLAKVAESRDQEMGGHLARMRAYSQILAEDLARSEPYAAQIDARFLEDLYRSSPLHDIGKVGIPDSILRKPGPLTADEFAVMQQHAVTGANILDEAVTRCPGGGFLEMAALIARYHHERFDGKGYPLGLSGRHIPLAARIVAVADVFDALTSVRPYKRAIPVQEAKMIVRGDSGRHFDPVVVEAFLRRFADLVSVRQEANQDIAPVYGASPIRGYPLDTAAAWCPQPQAGPADAACGTP